MSPDIVFIVGAPRSGTSSLFSALASVPECFPVSPKEPHALVSGADDPFCGPYESHPMHSIPSVDRWRMATEGYASERVIIDGSTSYLYLSSARRSIAEASNSRVIVLVRDPLQRALSAFQYARSLNIEPLAIFSEAYLQEQARREAGWSPIYWYSEAGRYSRFIQQYLRDLGQGRVFVTSVRDLVSSPSRRSDLGSFIGLHHPVPVPGHVNRSGAPRVPALYRWLSTPQPLKRWAMVRMPPRSRQMLRRAAESLLLPTPTRITTEAHGWIREAFESQRQREWELLGALGCCPVAW